MAEHFLGGRLRHGQRRMSSHLAFEVPAWFLLATAVGIGWIDPDGNDRTAIFSEFQYDGSMIKEQDPDHLIFQNGNRREMDFIQQHEQSKAEKGKHECSRVQSELQPCYGPPVAAFAQELSQAEQRQCLHGRLSKVLQGHYARRRQDHRLPFQIERQARAMQERIRRAEKKVALPWIPEREAPLSSAVRRSLRPAVQCW